MVVNVTEKEAEIEKLRSRSNGALTLWNGLGTEAKCCALVLTSVAAYSMVYILSESLNHDETASGKSRTLGPGWWIIGGKQDIADFEWTLWFSEAKVILISFFIGHLSVGYLTNYFLPQFKEECNCVYAAFCISFLFGGTYIIMMTTICFAFFYLAKQNSPAYVAYLCGSALLIFNLISLPKVMVGEIDVTVMSQSAITYAIFRSCSFALESIKQPSEENTLLKLLQYNFYFPYFFFGPVMTYDAFTKQKRVVAQDERFLFLRDVIKVLAYIITVDFLRHFLHISCLPLDSNFMANSTQVVVGFLAFANVYLDWIKGRVLYAITCGIARHVDGYSDVPSGPKNMARIYTFADTFFDRGIQHWLCRYVYDPIGKGHSNLMNEALAGAVSFFIVLLTQGIGWQSITFTFLNWAGLTLEFYLKEKFNGISDKRVLAAVLGLNYWCILLFNCVGINGIEAFAIYFRKLFVQGGLLGAVVTILLGYCYAYLNREIINMEVNDKKTN